MENCNTNANHPIQYQHYESGKWTSISSEIVVEAPVSLTVNGEMWLTFMCSPVDLEALAIGFLYNEGIIKSTEEIASVRVCPTCDNVDVWLNKNAEKPVKWRRTSGCTGGFTSIEDDDYNDMIKVYNGSGISPNQICALIGRLFEAQDIYRRTGGVHTSGLSDGKNMIIVAEDIGRHNTLDKIAGKMLLENVQPPQRVLISTGRISSEMLQKASRIGAAYVISRTSPSSLSIKLANRYGITLIGYARRNGFRVYSNTHRVIDYKRMHETSHKTKMI